MHMQITYLERLFYFLSSHINIFKIEPEIHKKFKVEQTKLWICQSQTKSDIDWICHHHKGKWTASLESKNTKLKTKSWIKNRSNKGGKKTKKLRPKHKLPNRPTLILIFPFLS